MGTGEQHKGTVEKNYMQDNRQLFPAQLWPFADFLFITKKAPV